jgi:hypothetical protein
MNIYQQLQRVYLSRLVQLGILMNPFFLIYDKFIKFRKKTMYWYGNAPDPALQSNIQPPSIPPSVESPSIYSTSSTETQTTPNPSMDGAVIGANAEALAVATGIDLPPNSTRKGRVRKPTGTPRATPIKKVKIAKPPRNPFHRSETGKLQLKRLQMGKRVETMTPRVEVLRERLETMEGRLTFVSGKLKLVVAELATRSEPVTEPVGGTCVEGSVSNAVVAADEDEEIELDDEIETTVETETVVADVE